MNPTDIRRFLAIAEAAGFSSYGRLAGADELELAVAAYGVALENVNGTPEQLLRLLIAEGTQDLPSAGRLAEIVRVARLNKLRREPPAAITTGSVMSPATGWITARDSYLADCQRDGRTPSAQLLARFDKLAARSAPATDALHQAAP